MKTITRKKLFDIVENSFEASFFLNRSECYPTIEYERFLLFDFEEKGRRALLVEVPDKMKIGPRFAIQLQGEDLLLDIRRTISVLELDTLL